MSATALYKALVYAKVPEELAEKAVDDLPHADSTLTQTEFHNEFKELRNEFQGLRDEFNELRLDLEKCATKEQQDKLRAGLEKCATKEQLDKLRLDLEKCATKEQLDKVRAGLGEVEVRLIKWMVGLTITSMLGTIGVMIGLFALFSGGPAQ